MNRTQQVYIQLISNSINDKHKQIDFKEVDEKQLVRLCKFHKNTGLIYGAMARQKDVPQNLLTIFEKGFYTEMMVYSRKMTIFGMVLDALNKKHIKHIVLKGMSYAKCYRQSEFRTMTDMDLVVSPEEIQRVDEIFMDLGGEFNYECSDEHVRCYTINKITVEIHTSAGYSKYFHEAYDYEAYFQKAIDESICVNDDTYEFLPYYKIVYAIFHTAKHFYESGCGVRMLTDVAVLVDYYKDDVDLRQMWIDLEEMGLKKFTISLFAICKKWFESGTERLNDSTGQEEAVKEIYMQMEHMEIAEDYILSGGVFGHKNVLGDMGEISHQNGKNNLTKMLKWAFPTYSHMRAHSNWFKNKSAILLPVAYVERFIRNANERGGFIQWGRKLRKEKKEKEIQRNIVKIMGLGDE